MAAGLPVSKRPFIVIISPFISEGSANPRVSATLSVIRISLSKPCAYRKVITGGVEVYRGGFHQKRRVKWPRLAGPPGERGRMAASKRILVVDDEAVVRNLLRDFFSCYGYQVETASDGIEAIGRFAPGEFDCIISDCVIPG
jgi:hypothetical protein